MNAYVNNARIRSLESAMNEQWVQGVLSKEAAVAFNMVSNSSHASTD